MGDLRVQLHRSLQLRRIYESRFHNIVENSIDGVLIVNREGTILFSNPAAAGMFGTQSDQLRGTVFGYPVIGADLAELDIISTNGQTIVVEMRVAETEWDGRPAFLIQLRDITRRKQMQESLYLAGRVFENSAEGILILDNRMKLISGNRAFTQITGYPPEEILGKEPAVLLSDQNGAFSFKKMFKEALITRSRWQGELECHSKDGRDFPAWVSAVVVRDSAGIISNYVVIFSDISERKANENALRLASVVFEQSAEAVTVLDENERYLSVNRSFTEVTGYTPGEVIGKTPRMLKSGRHDEVFYREMWRQLNEAGRWQGEIWNRRKSGEVYPEWLSISSVRDENGKIVNYIGIFSDITERKQHEAQISQLAFFDPLTGLPNRALLMDRLKQSLASAERSGMKIAVIFMDLDRFKEINDTQGHDTGDLVLVEAARRFQSILRQGETLARLGGDEFVVLVETAESAGAAIVVERLKQSLLEPVAINEFSFSIGVSCGISVFPEDGKTGEELIKQADIAMYRAKNSRIGYCFYHTEMSAALADRIGLAQRMRNALAKNDFQLFFQPQVNLRTGRLVGAEALLRWFDSEEGWVSPQKFIPIAEERGLMIGLGEWVLRAACHQLQRWPFFGKKIPGRLAINISSQEIEAADFSERVAGILRETSTDSSLLELELTEGGLLRDVSRALSAMQSLRNQQFSLAIDDFGTGHSSLSYLTRFPVHKLKIDGVFVKNLLKNAQDYTIVQTIIAMAHSLGLRVVAEGIEEEAQVEALLAMGCEEGQGFYFGHAESPSDFAQKWFSSDAGYPVGR